MVRMKLPFLIAWRYVFSKNKVNAINIISRISIAGLSVGTAALILVMSVFNGLAEIIGDMYNAYNPDLVAYPREGKRIVSSTIPWDTIFKTKGLLAGEEVIEELALFTYGDNQAFGTIKGVGVNYQQVTRISDNMFNGQFLLEDEQFEYAVCGIGMAEKLSVNIHDPLRVIQVYAPKRKSIGIQTSPFASDMLVPAGNFMIQHEYDNEIVFAPIEFTRRLYQMAGECSSIEFRVEEREINTVKRQIVELLGPDFVVKDRQEQDEAFLKIQNLEKWISFAILSFTILLVAFNLLGVLWMIAREKSRDMAILHSIGLKKSQIRWIFYFAGMIFGVLSIGIGFSVSLILYWLQKTVGLVRIPEGFAVSSYPVALDFSDFLAAGIVVLIISIAAAIPAAYRAASQDLTLKENAY
jgi:lipoprotein-releasing system permease protein